MISKSLLKKYSLLKNKKQRRQLNLFIAEGERTVVEGLKSEFDCEAVLFLPGCFPNEFDINKLLIPCFELTPNEFSKISDTKNSQGIIALFKIPKIMDIKKSKLIIGLEDVSDPGNLGTIIRNCDWFGINSIMLSEKCASVYNPKVVRSSTGSIFHLNAVVQKNFYTQIEKLKQDGYKIYIADLDGRKISETKLNEKSVIVFCNEAHGASEKLKTLCDVKLTIPLKGYAESLNVASASAVIMYELTKFS